MKCDFCSSKQPRWCYPASDFIFDHDPACPVLNESKGAWAACAVCAVLINKNDYAALRDRAWSTLFDSNKAIREHVYVEGMEFITLYKEVLEQLHSLFMRRRTTKHPIPIF